MVTRNLFSWNLCLVLALIQLSCIAATPPSAPLFLRNLGTQDPRIINGTEALLDNTKHQASIRNRVNDNIKFGGGHLCGASLISENVVLCAAHCFLNPEANDGSFLPEKDFIVVMGNLNRSEKNNNTLVFDIEEIIKYNDVFSTDTFDDDIVLLLLNGSVPTDHPTVRPIALNTGSLEKGTDCQVTGWGKTEKGILPELLLTVDVPVISTTYCRTNTIYGDKIHEGMLCAGHIHGFRDSCQGDSGGPLVCAGVQAGIVSWGIECAKPNQPGIYTDVAFYKHWIVSKVAEYDVAMPKFVDISNNGKGGNNGTNGTTGGGGGDGAMSNFNGSVFLVVFMTIFGAILSKF